MWLRAGLTVSGKIKSHKQQKLEKHYLLFERKSSKKGCKKKVVCPNTLQCSYTWVWLFWVHSQKECMRSRRLRAYQPLDAKLPLNTSLCALHTTRDDAEAWIIFTSYRKLLGLVKICKSLLACCQINPATKNAGWRHFASHSLALGSQQPVLLRHGSKHVALNGYLTN